MVLLLLLVALAPATVPAQPAAGDAGRGGVRIDARPDVATTTAGSAVDLEFLVANHLPRAVTLDLAASFGRALEATLERDRLRLDVNHSHGLKMRVVIAADAPVGDHLVTLSAREDPSQAPHDATLAEATGSFLVRVVPKELAPPVLTPEIQEIPTAGDYAFQVENPSTVDRVYLIRIRNPVGWRHEVADDTLDVPAGTTRAFNVTFTFYQGGSFGAGAIVASDADGSDQVELRFRAPPMPVHHAPPVVLHLEPDVLDLPLRGSAVTTLRIENPTSQSYAPMLDWTLPPGVTTHFAEPIRMVDAGTTATFPVFFAYDGPREAGQTLEAWIGGQGATSRHVLLRLVEPTPAPSSAPAPEPPPAPAPGPAAGFPFSLAQAPWILVAAGVATVGGAVGLLAWIRHKWPWALAALSTRLLPSRVLALPMRERIVALVRERPGITFGELRRALRVGAGTLTYHARVLEKAGVIFSRPDGQTRRFYPVGAGPVEATPPLSERALTALRERGPMRASDLARELGVSRQALHYHLKRMMEEGTLVGRPEGRDLVLRAP